MPSRLVLTLVLVAATVAAAASAAGQKAGTLSRALVGEVRAAGGRLPTAEAQDLREVYEHTGGAPVWVDATGRATPRVRQGLALLQGAAVEGLRPADYAAPELSALAADVDARRPVDPARAAQLDVRLTSSVLRYLRHLHLGRITPTSLKLQIDLPIEAHRFSDVLWSALAGDGLPGAAADMAPPLAQYGALRTMLARYRAIAPEAYGTLALTSTIRPGAPFPEVAVLRRRLMALGDLPPDTPPAPAGEYDDVTRAGVVRFQQRHGLDADGVLGPATGAALRVPLAWRVRQLEMALERLRWLPDLGGQRLIVVNIPMFRLYAWDSVPSAAPPSLDMGVIVGRALDTRTPVFAASMQTVVFRPFWNVPTSILRNEMLPILRRDPDYLARQDMEIVRGQADSATVLLPTPEHIAALGTGNVRLRQKPGTHNALGRVKFLFPNDNAVYLHDTPARQLFRRSRRDFSHGCIRVEDPAGLATWVLGREADWTRERVTAAMQGKPNAPVELPEPIQVVIFYTTAAVMPGDGSVHFATDLYGHDATLAKRF